MSVEREPRLAIPLAHALVLAGTLAAAACGSKGPPKLFLGQSCVGRENDCASGLCLSFDSQTAFCTQACDREAQDCPDSFLCQPTADPPGDHCVLRALVDNCADDSECPAGHRCDTSAGPGLGVCYIPVQRGLCAPCKSSLQCPEGGGCFETTSGEHFCTQPCGAGCPAGYTCQTLPELGDQCVPERQTCSGGKPVCASCRGDAECGGYLDLCVENLVTGEHFCGKVCDPAQPESCPLGFGCIDLSGAGEGPYQCVPNASTCEGYCDAAPDDRAKAEAQCGFGRACELETFSCVPADDGRLCAPCVDDDDCRQGTSADKLCMVNVGTGETFCGDDCSTSPCPIGFSCIDVKAFGVTHKQCVPTRGTCLAGTGRLGDECTANGAADCITGICLDFGAVDLCSARCSTDAECGADQGSGYTCCSVTADGKSFDCSQSPSGGSQGVCAPIGGTFGADCSPGQPPCRSGVCLDIGTARLCTKTCQDDSACPENFACSPAVDQASGADTKICFPAGGGGMGADCSFGPAACASRYCIKASSGNLCTVRCAEDGSCPDPWVCDPNVTTVDGKQVALCFPPRLAP
ncbi:MAG: hypothetical protein D6729_19655 [Deltaproteobacteria bacterium]|nr:MAG: hypothetical protein D6729_19655 [Deltaproteobacteria bacterium]